MRAKRGPGTVAVEALGEAERLLREVRPGEVREVEVRAAKADARGASSSVMPVRKNVSW